jgi:hypothetical protein
MLHLDTVVATRDDLQIHRDDRALALGANELLDRTDDQDEPLYVFADPAGHPFCIFVGRPADHMAAARPARRNTSKACFVAPTNFKSTHADRRAS